MRGPPVCLFKFGSTRGKQACASRATDTRDLRARGAVYIRAHQLSAPGAVSCRFTRVRFVLANEEEIGAVKFV